MNKKSLILSVIFLLVFSSGISQIYAKTPKVNGKQYMANVYIDKDTNELEKNGDICVPYHLYMGFNEKNKTCYGSLVRPKRISATDGFGLEQLAISKGKLKGAKKLVFNLVREDTTTNNNQFRDGKIVYKKIRAIIRKNGKYLILKMPDVKENIQKVEFHPYDTSKGGIFINNLPNVDTLDNGNAKKGNTIAGVRIITDKDQILPDPDKDAVSVATTGMYEGAWWTVSMEAEMVKKGSIYSSQVNEDYFEYEQEIIKNGLPANIYDGLDQEDKIKHRFVYQSEQFNRRGYMTNMGGEGKSPNLNDKKVKKLSRKFIEVQFNDPDGIHFGFYAELNVKNPKKIWIIETGRNADNDYAYVKLQKKLAFSGQIEIKITNPDGTSSKTNVVIPK